MDFITSSKELSNAFRKLLKRCSTVDFAVAWASIGFPEYDALVTAEVKIGQAVIGTHFYQTAPEIIEKFNGNERVRFIRDHSTLFHPKLYLFQHGGDGWSCIVGSANFTVGGFSKNKEACLLVTDADDPEGKILAKVHESINHYWNDASPAADIDIDRYRKMRQQFTPLLSQAAGHFGSSKTGRLLEDIKLITMSWTEFLSRVRADNNLAKRLDVLNAARRLFRGYGTLENMSSEDRKNIAGLREDHEINWRWFGNMRPAGHFNGLLTNNDVQEFSAALDQIPLEGVVSRVEYLAFIEEYKKAFPLRNGNPVGHGMATATRLLAMKRPDYFVCLDRANKKNLCGEFGIAFDNHDYEAYWDEIVGRLPFANWWNVRRPSEKIAGQIWDGRAAMLDAIYYEQET